MRSKRTFELNLPGSFILRVAGLLPLFVLVLFFVLHPKTFSSIHQTESNKGDSMLGEAFLSPGLRGWQVLSWKEKERRVDAAILFFREKTNCAILRSPGHYVVSVDRLLQQDPSLQEQDLLAVLRGLAIQEYDFYSGVNAEEQALHFLGPELFLRNQEARRSEVAGLQPVHEKK